MKSSHPIVIVQSICTTWTKASRGGENASIRNRTPEAVKLPALPPSVRAGDLFIHEVTYGESNHFQHPLLAKLEQQELAEPFRYNCLKLSVTENILNVVLEWERSEGHPRRVALTRKVFQLSNQQWGRIRYNLRTMFGWQGIWMYKKYVLNIGFFSPSSAEVFLETEPAHIYSDMAHLW